MNKSYIKRFLEWMNAPREQNNSYLRIRNYIGILGCLLPILSLAGAALSPNTMYPDWWTSISGTYYSSPVLIAVLSGVAFFLIIYRGYNNWDTLVNTVAGICAFGVVCFPCNVSWVSTDVPVGMFWLPGTVTTTVHFISAAILFLMLSLNSICLFSKSSDAKKNRLYKICGWVILADLVIAALNAAWWHKDWTVIVNEAIMLFAFGISWLVKGHLFDNWFKPADGAQ